MPDEIQTRFIQVWVYTLRYDEEYIRTFLTSPEWKKYKYTDPAGQVADGYCLNSSLIDSTNYTTQDSFQIIYYGGNSIGSGQKATAPCSY